MDLQDGQLLSNNFQNVRLYRLPPAQRPGESTGAPPATAVPVTGPYVVMQTAVDPDDARGTIDDFILSRHGHWLPYYLFHQLPEEAREEEYYFDNAAEAIGVLEGLTGKAVIDRPTASPPPPPPSPLAP